MISSWKIIRTVQAADAAIARLGLKPNISAREAYRKIMDACDEKDVTPL